MKEVAWVVLICILVVGAASPAFANEYTDQMKAKYVRGVTNVFSCIGEIGRSMSEEINSAESPVYGGLIGIFTGTGRMIIRAASGIYDIVVAPIPGIMTFPPEPETLFGTGIEDQGAPQE